MRLFHWSLLGFLFRTATFSSATPISIVPLARRSHVCANAPTTVAGTLLPRHAPHPPSTPSPRTTNSDGVVNSMIWCAKGSRTYVVTTLKPAVEGAAIMALVNAATLAIVTHIKLNGDGLIPGGEFNWAGGEGARLTMLNANSHQLTWGVMGAALHAVGDEMTRLAMGGSAGYFTIVDGETQVGTGMIYDGWEVGRRK